MPVDGAAPASPLQAMYERVLAYIEQSKDRLLAIGYVVHLYQLSALSLELDLYTNHAYPER